MPPAWQAGLSPSYGVTVLPAERVKTHTEPARRACCGHKRGAIEHSVEANQARAHRDDESVKKRRRSSCPSGLFPALELPSRFACHHSLEMYRILMAPEAQNAYEWSIPDDDRKGVNWYAFVELLVTRCPNLLDVRTDAGQTVRPRAVRDTLDALDSAGTVHLTSPPCLPAMNARQILHVAARHGKASYLQLIYFLGDVETDIRDNEDDTPLIASTSGGDASCDAAEVLIRYGANPNHANNDGCTPLYYSGRGRHERLVRLLLENGARWDILNEPDSLGESWTPFCVAVEHGHEAVARQMIAHGADITLDLSAPTLLELRDAVPCRLSGEGLRCLNSLKYCARAETIEPGHARVQW
jgi:hypothetical protein